MRLDAKFTEQNTTFVVEFGEVYEVGEVPPEIETSLDDILEIQNSYIDSEISEIGSPSYDKGYEEGYELGYKKGYDNGFEAGEAEFADITSADDFLTNNVSVLDSDIATIRDYACYSQSKITSVNLPNLTRIGTHTFRACTQLTKINAPKVTYLGSYCFYTCSKLAKVDFPVLATIDTYCFAYCSALTAVIMRSSTVVTLVNSSAFNNSAVAKGTGFIYVPASLVDSYKSASNWSTYANQIRAIEDYPDICG